MSGPHALGKSFLAPTELARCSFRSLRRYSVRRGACLADMPLALGNSGCVFEQKNPSYQIVGQRRSSHELARLSSVCRSTAGSANFPDGGYSAPSGRYSETAAKIRGFLFYLWTFTLALPLFVAMVLQAPFVLLLDKHRRLAQHFVNDLWAKVSTRPFYTVQDIFSLFHLSRPFKFISKTSIFFYPIVGWSMFLTGHVKLNRMDKRSQLACLTQCRELLQRGASVLFFPEGTRATDMRLQEFKKGAFSVAAKAQVPVVPITIIGTGKKMPNRQENKMFPGGVQMVIHPRVEPADARTMLEKARKAVQSRLP